MTENKDVQKQTDVFIHVGRDGGVGKHAYTDVKQAYAVRSPIEKRRAFTMLAAAGVTFAVLLLSRLLWLFEPLFDKVYYGTLSEIIYYILLGLIYSAFVVSLNVFIKKRCSVRLFRVRKHSVSTPRALAVIGIAAMFVFIVNASLNFTLKMQLEMGLGVTAATALTNIAVYIYYGLHLWLGFIAATLVQYGMSLLFPAKYTVPWGGVFLVTVFGLTEFLLESLTTPHLYTWIYYLFTYAYAMVFYLSGRGFHISYWASVIIMVL